ncbi:hypothetical protein B6S44_24860 [Bosea sp. Tri-44]|nr:hypothetical protein B6S44_24860 [Bosea sp. Tri-44]
MIAGYIDEFFMFCSGIWMTAIGLGYLPLPGNAATQPPWVATLADLLYVLQDDDAALCHPELAAAGNHDILVLQTHVSALRSCDGAKTDEGTKRSQAA